MDEIKSIMTLDIFIKLCKVYGVNPYPFYIRDKWGNATHYIDNELQYDLLDLEIKQGTINFCSDLDLRLELII